MSENRRRRKAANAPGRQGGFQLPPNVSVEKQRLSYGWACVFRHGALGQLGRVVLQDKDDGRCQLSCEVMGDPADPMTAERRRIFEPLGLELRGGSKRLPDLRLSLPRRTRRRGRRSPRN